MVQFSGREADLPPSPPPVLIGLKTTGFYSNTLENFEYSQQEDVKA
jgi:hypothetical protein